MIDASGHLLRGTWDVVVVGAGAAGALAARQLALGGRSVLLVDKAGFPRDKVCGCCLNAAAMTALACVGLGGVPDQLGAVPLTRLSLACPGAGASIRIRSVAVSRAAFDWALVREAIASGAEFKPRTVARVELSGRVCLRSADRCGEEMSVLEPRAVLVADGLAGSSFSGCGFAAGPCAGTRIGAATILDRTTPDYPAGAIHMTIGRRGYVGAVRLEDHRLNVAAALEPAFVRDSGGPGRAIAALLADAGMPPLPTLDTAKFHATPALTRRRPTLQTNRVLILGDAAGYVEPFTGEGIAWALASAITAAPIVLGRSPWESWASAHRRLISPRQRLCRGVAWALRRPRLTLAAVRAMSVIPLLARPAVRRVELPFPEPAT